MAKYGAKFQYQAIEKAVGQGIKTTARELKVSRNTLKKWIKAYSKGEIYLRNHQPSTDSVSEIEKFVVSLKEREPIITLKRIQKVMKQKKGKFLSIQRIQRILEKYGMTNRSLLPLISRNTPTTQNDFEIVQILLKQGNIKKAAKVLNSLAALSDFSILKEIPPQFLSTRRQAEQLDTLSSTLPMAERYRKAKELRKRCEKKKLFFTGAFIAALEMNALNFLGEPAKLFSLYCKYCKYLPRLPLPLKYTILLEYFIFFNRTSEKYPEKMLKNFSYKLTHFCTKLPKGHHRIHWYNIISNFFQIIGKINRSLEWKERLLKEELSLEDRKKYLPQYLSLLAVKGAYSDILRFNEPFESISTPSFLVASLAQAIASLGAGKPKEAIEIALDIFYKAEKEHLLSAMAGFTLFIACAYNALKETKKAKQYLKMSLYFSRNIKRLRILCSLLLGITPPISYSQDPWINLANLYLLACETLRRRDYLKAHKFAERNGFLGFFHRIILLHPEAVVNLLKRGEETYLPKEFLNLPIFREELPVFKLFFLKEKDSLFYRDRKIDISPHSRDFHLIVYLFLNRRKYLNKENLFDIFYKKTKNPAKSLTKALSRIRRILNLSKGVLSSKRGRVLFDTEAKIDLEEFEQRFKMGKILEKVGEIERAMREYWACFTLYNKGPFEQMGYYYNFAEERRMIARDMFRNSCNALINDAEEKGEIDTVRKIKKKFKKEELVFDSAKD